MHMLSDKIINDNGIFKSNLLNELRNSEIPNYIYGAGVVAQTLIAGLKSENINISGVFVDPEYWSEDMICGISQYKIGNDKLLNTCNLIVGFNTSPEEILLKINSIYGNNGKYNVLQLDLSLFEKDHISYDYFLKHSEDFEKIYSICADDESRDAIISFINTKITCNPIYLKNIVSSDQYFISDIVKLCNDAIFVDCGAYNGDTILSFNEYCNNKYNQIIAFEPDSNNICLLKDTLNKHNIHNVDIHNSGVWDHTGELWFSSSGNQSSKLLSEMSPDDIKVKVECIDDVINNMHLNSNAHLLIKMDVEGAEYNAILGCERTIKEFHPILAICVYHKKDDIINIINLIHKYSSNYKIYFRHHSRFSVELVCYAIYTI